MVRKDEPIPLWWSLVAALMAVMIGLLVLGVRLGEAWVYAHYS